MGAPATVELGWARSPRKMGSRWGTTRRKKKAWVESVSYPSTPLSQAGQSINHHCIFHFPYLYIPSTNLILLLQETFAFLLHLKFGYLWVSLILDECMIIYGHFQNQFVIFSVFSLCNYTYLVYVLAHLPRHKSGPKQKCTQLLLQFCFVVWYSPFHMV